MIVQFADESVRFTYGGGLSRIYWEGSVDELKDKASQTFTIENVKHLLKVDRGVLLYMAKEMGYDASTLFFHIFVYFIQFL